MAAIKGNVEAQAAYERAHDLVIDLSEGAVAPSKEAAAIAEAGALLDEVLAYYRSTENDDGAARAIFTIGYKARHVDDDTAEATSRLQQAADMFAALEKHDDRLAALIELGELMPAHEEARQAAFEAIGRDLADPLEDRLDPRRLAMAISISGDTDGALALYEALLEDATAKDRQARAAVLLRDIARVHEEYRSDKVEATRKLEACLDCAEKANDKAEIGAALLRLADIWSERGNRRKSRAYFERVAGMRGLPHWQRVQIDVLRTVFG